MNRTTAIDIEKQKFAMTMPRMAIMFTAVAICSVAYTQLATRSYVDEKHDAVVATMGALAKSQQTAQDQMDQSAKARKEDTKKLKLLVRLTSVMYMEHLDEAESKPKHRRPQRSAKARKIAAALQMDPDDPLAGVELLSDALEE